MDQILDEALVIEVNASSPHLAAMETCINELIDGTKPEITCLENLRRLINIEFRPMLCTRIGIAETDDTQFFGACVIPDTKYFEQIVKDGMTPQNSPQNVIFKEYSIEIDRKLISEFTNLDAKEILACILHEIGHTASDAKLVCAKAIVNDIMLRLPLGMLSIGVGGILNNIYAIGGGLIICVIMSLYDHGMEYWRNLRNEKMADSVAFKCG